MTSDDVDAINDSLSGIVESWTDDWLTRVIAELRSAFDRFGKPLKEELTSFPDSVTPTEREVIRRWIAIHVDDSDPDSGDDRWFRELAAAGTDVVTMLYVFGKRAHPLVRLPRSLAGRHLRTLWWAVNGWRLPRVLSRFHDVGIVAKLPPLARLATDCERGELSETEMLVKALAKHGTCLAIDPEFSGQPVPHDGLVRSFGWASGGAFTPTNTVQSPRNNADYTISFDHAGRRHTFAVPENGDIFDTHGVAVACNGALAAAGSTVRFHAMDSDLAVFVCGEPTTLALLDDELFLWLDDLTGGFNQARHDARVARLQQAVT